MAELSILLPSLRPDAVRRKVEEFLLTNADVDYELVIVSPFKVEGERVVHVPETERRGVIHAINEAYRHDKGQYIVLWSDDATPEHGCLRRMLDFVRNKPIPFLASFRRRGLNGKEAEQWAVYGKLYAGWLCAARQTFDRVGGLFEPSFKNYWADPDLSLRVWKQGGKVEVCKDAWIGVEQIDDQVKSDNLSSSFDKDTSVFFERWHSEFGKGARKVWTDINVPVPHSLGGHVRAVLRRVPLLRKIKRSVANLAGQ